MPFIPHTDQDIQSMLDAIGVSKVEDLFDEIPESLRSQITNKVPEGLNEHQITRVMSTRARQDGTPECYMGAGAYDHHIPAAVWEITTRGEYYTAYTPYQAEASQGTLQLLYEFQTMMASLNGMDVSNASLYDGASALAEAVLMAIRSNRKSKSKTILIPKTVHPNYRKTVKAIVSNQGIEIEEIDFDIKAGKVDMSSLKKHSGEFAALVIPQPNFFGQLEAVDQMTDWAHEKNALVIAAVNPIALAVIKPPGQWGQNGADISCGEGQPLGVPMSSGGPYYGFLCCKQAWVRQMPGRIIGRTVDLENRQGFSLTLQAREQHIRRSKATSNICTNQGLIVTASTIFMAIMGPEGLRRMANQSLHNTHMLAERLTQVEGIEAVFTGPYFHETVVKFNCDLAPVLQAMSAQNIIAGYPLGEDYPELENCLLICVTETKTEQDLDRYMQNIEHIMQNQNVVKCS
jgi:glycine dehydrogenase subunit 1